MTTSLGSINLLQWPTELTETCDFLEHWFILKGGNSGTATGQAGTGQDVRKAGAPMLSWRA